MYIYIYTEIRKKNQPEVDPFDNVICMSCPRQPLVQNHSQAPDTFLKFQGSAHKNSDRVTVHISFLTSYTPACPHTDHVRLLSIQLQPISRSPKFNGSQISVDALHSPSHFIRRKTQVDLTIISKYSIFQTNPERLTRSSPQLFLAITDHVSRNQENGYHSDFGIGAHIFGYLKKSSGAAMTHPESRLFLIKELTRAQIHQKVCFLII
jgi:hypothetical protein